MSDINVPGAAGQDTPPPAAAPAAPAGTPPPAAAPVLPWYPNADEVTVGYLQNKGWKEPSDILNAYRGAEKFISAPIEQRLVIPGPDAKPEDMAKFYDRLGRPSDPSGYKIEVPEGAPKEFAQSAAKVMHEAGIPKEQGEKLAAWWNGQAQAAQAAEQTRAQQDVEQGNRNLASKWGAAYTQELAKAQNAARALGVTTEQIDNLQRAMGHQATMEFFNAIGNKVGEADFVTGKSEQGFGAMTPVQAKAKITELRADKEFIKRYVAKDANAVAEMARLHAFAFPEEK